MDESFPSSLSLSEIRFRNLDIPYLETPLHRLVVVSGRSGAGKTTLLRDILFSEARRRYQRVTGGVKSIEEKCFHGQVRGLPFALFIQGKNKSRTWLPSVLSESGLSRPLLEQALKLPEFCPQCHGPLERQTPERLRNYLLNVSSATKYLQLEIVFETLDTLREYSQSGFSRARVGEEEWRIEDLLEHPQVLSDPEHRNDHSIVYDRFPFERIGSEKRLFRALRELGEKSRLAVTLLNEEKTRIETQRLWHHPFCRTCEQEYPTVSLADLSPRFRDSQCQGCHGQGVIHRFSEDLLISEADLPILHGGFRPFLIPSLRPPENQIQEICTAFGINSEARFSELRETDRKLLLFGRSGNKDMRLGAAGALGEKTPDAEMSFVELLRSRYLLSRRVSVRTQIQRFLVEEVCPSCEGARLRAEILSRRYGNNSLKDLLLATVADVPTFFPGPVEAGLARILHLLGSIGLSYLPLSQAELSLSNGERQRMRLIRGVVAHVSGVLYLLDEPLGGLFPSDRMNVCDVFHDLLAEGNSLFAAENDPQLIRVADVQVVLGPGAGKDGGKVVSQGAPVRDTSSEIVASLSEQESSDNEQLPLGMLRVSSIRKRNLQEISVEIPLGKLSLVAGPSGSGKTTLVREVIVPLLRELFQRRGERKYKNEWAEISFEGEVVQVCDATKVIGKLSHRSSVASYSHILSALRELYLQLPQSKVSGDVARSRFQGLLLSEVMNRSVSENLQIFRNIPFLARLLKRIERLGLGYLQLNQPANSLAEGEIQRLSLVRSIPRSLFSDMGPRTILVCDEPARGLREDEALEVGRFFRHLCKNGHTVILIEHHLALLSQADFLIELGPGGGPEGGRVLFQGPAKKIREAEASRMKTYLEQYSENCA